MTSLEKKKKTINAYVDPFTQMYILSNDYILYQSMFTAKLLALYSSPMGKTSSVESPELPHNSNAFS